MRAKTNIGHINKADKRGNDWLKWENGIKNYAKIITYIYLFFLIVVMPFYAPQGYVDIGMNKYYFFRITGIVCFALLVPAVLVLLFIRLFMLLKHNRSLVSQFSVTDTVMVLYGTAVIFSFICTEWKEEALWGTDGWYMGAVSQLMFVMIYFVISRFAEKEKIWYVIFIATSFFVFLLGLLNRFSVYPLELDGANPIFISTLGNINWFCSYWMVMFPVGLVFYWMGAGDTIWKKTGLVLYIIVGFMTGIVQGSSSGFLALGAMIFTLFCLSFKEGKKLLRWLELLFMLVVSTFFTGVLKSCFPENLNYDNVITGKLADFSVNIPVLAIVAVGYAVLRYLIEYKELRARKLVVLRNATVGIFAFIIIVVAGLVVYYSIVPEAAEKSQLAQAFVIDSDWGNSRGTTWTAGVMAMQTMSPWRMLVGVGPDCFSNYVYREPEIAVLLYNVFGDARLTNAHNEWLTALVNLGLYGFLSYVIIFISALIRQIKGSKNNEIALVSAVCIISYIIHNMVSFQQVICTPIVFIMLGMGEGILRRQKTKK